MPGSKQPKPRVLVDADVLFAAAASSSEHGASLLILRLAELTLIDAITPRQVVTEAERNLQEKLPNSVAAMRLLVARCLHVMDDPSLADLAAFSGRAHEKDLSILIAAAQNQCKPRMCNPALKRPKSAASASADATR
jgi:hypothetical protein